MKKVLFISEQWSGGRQERGPSDANYLKPTLLRGDAELIAESSVIYFDTLGVAAKRSADAEVLAEVERYQPDIVIFYALVGYQYNIALETWAELRSRGIKVVAVWLESTPDVVAMADNYADSIDLNVFVDSETIYEKHTKRSEKCLGTYHPQDSFVFTPETEKAIGVSFIGTLVARPIRCSYIFALLASGVAVTKLGGHSEWLISTETMIKVLRYSRIVLNFGDAGSFKHYKIRVAEATLCGSLLMDWENDETLKIFEPYREFVPFSTPEDLLKKVKYYLTHESERAKIAAAGRERALERLDGREFWKKVFERLEIESLCL